MRIHAGEWGSGKFWDDLIRGSEGKAFHSLGALDQTVCIPYLKAPIMLKAPPLLHARPALRVV